MPYYSTARFCGRESGGGNPPSLTNFWSRVGQVLAERAQEKGITSASWPRKKGQRYHGKVAALLDSFQQSGVKLA